MWNLVIEAALAAWYRSAALARRWRRGALLCLGMLLGVAVAGLAQAPQTSPSRQVGSAPAPPDTDAAPEPVLPGDWGPELLYGILNSPNEEAQYGILRATFAAGPEVVPQLAVALKDDRTAEYAAQSLAFIGGEQALPILMGLLSDPRDLNLRRFAYGALAEFDSPQATNALFDAIDKSDAEPDRTVTECAVIALTVRTDPALLPRLLTSEKKLQDVVIRDDLDNARAVIEERTKFLASPAGKAAGGSIESAVRTYFMPALGAAPAPSPAAPAKASTTPVKKTALNSNPAPSSKPAAPEPPPVSVSVRNVTLSPDKQRALARVVFEDPTAIAYYDFVLQKRYGNWTLASVWLGPEAEKQAAAGGQQQEADK